MKYCWTTLQVRNIEESIEFYQKVIGLGLKRRFKLENGGEFAFLGDGETQIELIASKHKEFIVGNAITLGFSVDSLDETLIFVKENGIEIESGPMQPNDHIRFFYILDPNGIHIQFSQSF